MKIKLESYNPILNGCLVGMVGIVLLKETPIFSLPDSLQNPDIGETQNEMKLLWPCVMPLSGVQQSFPVEKYGSAFREELNHLSGNLSLAIKTSSKI